MKLHRQAPLLARGRSHAVPDFSVAALQVDVRMMHFPRPSHRPVSAGGIASAQGAQGQMPGRGSRAEAFFETTRGTGKGGNSASTSPHHNRARRTPPGPGPRARRI